MTADTHTAQLPWYRRWFADAMYADLYAHRDEGEARCAIDLFEAIAQPPHAGRVLDLACGSGRHSFELARRCYRVTAADLSPALLDMAVRKTQRHRTRVHLVRADMRTLPFAQCFDAVVQLFTAFGYFDDDAENARVIADAACVLRPHGTYMLDFLNAAQVRDTLVPCSEADIDGRRVRQERRITNGRVEKRITVGDGASAIVFMESVRLYEPQELEGMFRAAGLAHVRMFGSYHGEPLARSSARCIMFGSRA